MKRGGVVLEDGPVAGEYSVLRAPFFLRAVLARNGRRDVLDQLDDRPAMDEKVHVYQAVPGTLFDPDMYRRQGIIVCPPPAASGRYRHRPDVDGEQLRDTDAWRAWARAEPAPEPLVDGVTLELRP